MFKNFLAWLTGSTTINNWLVILIMLALALGVASMIKDLIEQNKKKV